MRQVYRAHWANASIAITLLVAGVAQIVFASLADLDIDLDNPDLLLLHYLTILAYWAGAIWYGRKSFLKIELLPEGISVRGAGKRRLIEWEDVHEMRERSSIEYRLTKSWGRTEITVYRYSVQTHDDQTFRFNSQQIHNARMLAKAIQRRIDSQSGEPPA